MRVPDGDDYVEFMLYRKMPDKFGTKNHISLVGARRCEVSRHS